MSYTKFATVRRNATKQIAAIMARATSAKAYSLQNGFAGVDVDLTWIRKTMLEDKTARLRFDGSRLTIRCHSNLWFEVAIAAEVING